jgi:hypothetical protein
MYRLFLSKIRLLIQLKTMLIISLILLSACASQQINNTKTDLTDKAFYLLQPVPQALENTGIQAIFNVKHKGENQQLIIQVEFTQENMIASGVTIEGLSLFSVNWHTKSNIIDFESKIELSPLTMLAQLQFALWPITSVNNGLHGAMMHEIVHQDKQKEHKQSAVNEKTITTNDQLLYRLSQQSKKTIIINEQKNYQLHITELERWKIK